MLASGPGGHRAATGPVLDPRVRLAVVALLAYLLFRIFEPFFGPIYWAFLLAFMLFPLNGAVRKRRRRAPRRSPPRLTLGVTLGIASPPSLGRSRSRGRRSSSASAFRRSPSGTRSQAVDDLLRIPVIGDRMQWLRAAHVASRRRRSRTGSVQGVQAAVQFLLAHSRDLRLRRARAPRQPDPDALHPVLLLPRRRRAGRGASSRLIPLDPGRKQRLSEHLQAVTRAVVFGTVVTALAQGTLLGVGFWITGLPSPLVFGVLAAVASFIPFVGTALVWVPAVALPADPGRGLEDDLPRRLERGRRRLGRQLPAAASGLGQGARSAP